MTRHFGLVEGLINLLSFGVKHYTENTTIVRLVPIQTINMEEN